MPIFRPPRTITVEFWNFPCSCGSSLTSTLANTRGDWIVSANRASSSGPWSNSWLPIAYWHTSKHIEQWSFTIQFVYQREKTYHNIGFKHIQKMLCHIPFAECVPNGASKIITGIQKNWIRSCFLETFHYRNDTSIATDARIVCFTLTFERMNVSFFKSTKRRKKLPFIELNYYWIKLWMTLYRAWKSLIWIKLSGNKFSRVLFDFRSDAAFEYVISINK